MTTLREQVALVAKARRFLAAQQELMRAARQAWDDEYKVEIENTTHLLKECATAEVTLRDMTLAAYHKTGDKHPVPGVDVRLIQQMNYDTAEALTWAMDKRLALKLDVNAFEKVAKVIRLDFVTIIEMPQATIASDLDAVLKGQETT